MRPRRRWALVGCAVAALLVSGGSVRSLSRADPTGGSPRGAEATLVSSSARARASADGMTVALYVSPSRATPAVAVEYRVQAEAERAHGALSYDFAYGDGATSSPVTPQFCLGGTGAPLRATWRLHHRYEKPGTYHVAVTVRAVCTPGRVTATAVIDVAGGASGDHGGAAARRV